MGFFKTHIFLYKDRIVNTVPIRRNMGLRKPVCLAYFTLFQIIDTLEFQIDGTPRLLIIPFFVTLPNLIQHYPFINFGEIFPFFQTPRLLIHVHSRQRYREAQAKPQNCLLYILFLPHRIKLFSDYNKALSTVKRRIEQKKK